MRKIAKKVLAKLTSWAIKKHDIEIIAILGEKQSRLTSYILWEFLREDYFTRCQWDRSFWDLSIPLTILGYEAKQRRIFGWIWLILKAFWVLLTQRARSQVIILHVPFSLPEILEYWFSIIRPSYVVAFKNDLNSERMRIIKKNIDQKKSRFIVIGKDVDEKWLKNNSIKHDLPGVYWDLPILGAAYIASKYGIKTKYINATLQNLEPLLYLKVRSQID